MVYVELNRAPIPHPADHTSGQHEGTKTLEAQNTVGHAVNTGEGGEVFAAFEEKQVVLCSYIVRTKNLVIINHIC